MKELSPIMQEEIAAYFEKHKIPEGEQKKMLEKIMAAFKKQRYDPEEAIGVVGAQSLSEPATQMTMRTYHFAGSAGIQITLGLPRLIEIFGARKEPTTEIMTVYLKKKYNTKKWSEIIAKKIKEKGGENGDTRITLVSARCDAEKPAT